MHKSWLLIVPKSIGNGLVEVQETGVYRLIAYLFSTFACVPGFLPCTVHGNFGLLLRVRILPVPVSL